MPHQRNRSLIGLRIVALALGALLLLRVLGAADARRVGELICHSFACFLSTRPNEQIYNNATERTKVVYVASLAGLVPAGPGHSHQSVRDIAALSGVPDLVLIAPGSAAEVPLALRYCLERTAGSSVLRLESMPFAPEFEIPSDYALEEGVGLTLSEGDAWFVGYGPLLLNEAVRASRLLAERSGLRVGVVNLPWLNRVDRAWVSRALGRASHVFTLDNSHYFNSHGCTSVTRRVTH